MPKRKTKLSKLWLKNPDYDGWLSKISDGLAYCSYCSYNTKILDHSQFSFADKEYIPSY